MNEGLSRILTDARTLTPREATVFLLDFERCFRALTGREATPGEQLVLSAVLRKTARESA